LQGGNCPKNIGLQYFHKYELSSKGTVGSLLRKKFVFVAQVINDPELKSDLTEWRTGKKISREGCVGQSINQSINQVYFRNNTNIQIML